MSEKGRVEYLDSLKFFAIFSVLVGHSTEQLSADIFWDHPLLMVPSLTAFAISCAIMLIAGVTAIADLCEISFSGFMNSVWFLKCVFFCYLIMYPLCKWLRKDWLASLVAVIAVLLIPGTEVVNLNFMLPMFCLGMCCGNHAEDIERHRKAWLAASAAVFLVLMLFWSGRLTVYLIPTRVVSEGLFDWQNLGLSIYRLALGAAGTLFFLSSCRACIRIGPQMENQLCALRYRQSHVGNLFSPDLLSGNIHPFTACFCADPLVLYRSTSSGDSRTLVVLFSR